MQCSKTGSDREDDSESKLLVLPTKLSKIVKPARSYHMSASSTLFNPCQKHDPKFPGCAWLRVMSRERWYQPWSWPSVQWCLWRCQIISLKAADSRKKIKNGSSHTHKPKTADEKMEDTFTVFFKCNENVWNMLFPYWEWLTICGICSSFSSPPCLFIWKICTLTDSEMDVGTIASIWQLKVREASNAAVNMGPLARESRTGTGTLIRVVRHLMILWTTTWRKTYCK